MKVAVAKTLPINPENNSPVILPFWAAAMCGSRREEEQEFAAFYQREFFQV